jgi:hypothetical protein
MLIILAVFFIAMFVVGIAGLGTDSRDPQYTAALRPPPKPSADETDRHR